MKDLTKKEMEVLELVSKGYTSVRIGEMLGISHRTVQKHREHIRKKLEIKPGLEYKTAAEALNAENVF